MQLLSLEESIAQLPLDPKLLSFHEKIETGFENIIESISSLVQIDKTEQIAPVIMKIGTAAEQKMEGAIATLRQLGSIIAEIKRTAEIIIPVVQEIYRLMLQIIHSLTPIMNMVASRYPVLIPVFAFLENLPAI